MKNKTLQTIKKYKLIENDMHIIIGLSGGPDSVCLFDILCSLAKENPEMNLKIYAVHVNHKLRPVDAEDDQRYVEELCAEYGVQCYTKIVDCLDMARKLNLSSEEAGRKARYDAFSETALNLHSAEQIPKAKIAIALAHNANDQCETILFRLIRGSGTDGLSGIAYKRFDDNGFAVIRPILDLTRNEIEKYCQERNLSPRIDHTNSENIYTRNKIRNMLIPYIEENFNENITETVNRLGKIASYDREFLRDNAIKAYQSAHIDKDNKKEALNIQKIENLHKAIRTRIYTIALEKVGMRENVSFSHLEAIDRLLYSDSPSASADLSDCYMAIREYDNIIFMKRDKAQVSKNIWSLRKMSREDYDRYKREANFHGAFSGVDIENLEVRTRRQGDKINIGTGIKKLQDFFVDEKLPKHYRDDVQVLARGSEILWIMPSELYSKKIMRQKGRFSADYKADYDSTGPIIVLEKL